LEAPASSSIQDQKRFIKKATQFYVQMTKCGREGCIVLHASGIGKPEKNGHQAHEGLDIKESRPL